MMQTLFRIIGFLSFALSLSCSPSPQKQLEDEQALSVEFVEQAAQKKIDVLVDGKLFTAYRWPDDVYKPILYPLISSGGTTVTRGFPLEPREGERNDHRHQVGNWLNYGNVNEFDFWGNGHSGERSANGGEIKHVSVEKLEGGAGEGVMITSAHWTDPSGKQLLSERTEFHFIAKDSLRIIDRITTLTAASGTVHFKDTKEGMFGIRVARALELPSEEEVTVIEKAGASSVVRTSNGSVTGNYRSSEGITGEKVWSTRAKWMNLFGTVGGENISLVVCDHPDNINYPTYWHARGYGLFSANPLGVKDFTGGKEELNYSLAPGKSLTFRYRIMIASGHLTDGEINAQADDFARKY
ncbi:MAG: PmoA family protein [Chryseosolibacter sp.]